MSVRRVVTGQRGGKSVFVSDERVEPVTVALMPGLRFDQIWGADAPVTLPTDGTASAATTYFPPAGGFRFSMVTLPPEAAGTAPAPADLGRATAEVEAKLPGLLAHMEPDHPGMHTSDTVDLDVVLAGDVFLELDDGAEVHLQVGDCVIMNGTRHAWHNRASEPCRLLSVLVGAPRSGQDV